MDKKKVLILGVAAVQMDAILQLKKMGYETYACAMANDGPGANVADHFIEINILDIKKITNYIIENNISVLYSVGSDLAMPVVSHISEKLKLPHFVSEKTAQICNNKNLMRETLGENFEGNVYYQVINNVEEKINMKYPFILKPADSQGQRGVKLITNKEEYIENFKVAKKFSRSGLVIAEEFISGPEISVNGYMVNGELQFLETSDRETWPEYTGLIHKHIVPSINSSENINNKIKEIIKNACNKIGIYNGPVYAQMKLEKNTPYIIEITPRLDGCHMWKLLDYATGINILELTFAHLINNDTSILKHQNYQISRTYTLEFDCQEPGTKAHYDNSIDQNQIWLERFNYYNLGDLIRPVNGIYDKIGYKIYEE